MASTQENRQIVGKTRSVRELLTGQKYNIDYYQREYRWEEKQIAELVDDLADCFLSDYDRKHERREVANYGYYFLGSIIVSQRNGQKYIVDGQQRLTSLTLLLIYLNGLQKSRGKKCDIATLIFSEKYGQKSFNIDVDERKLCMEALFEGREFEDGKATDSVKNIVARYEDIENLFPADLKEDALPYFMDWLIDNVFLVEIAAFNDEDAYTIFETMNDRGLSLTATEMLKGYLLANINNAGTRNECNTAWKEAIQRLRGISEKDGKDEDADCIKAWLRSRHAQSIREHKRGAKPEDFDKIGTEFHRWVRDQEERLDLSSSDSFARFIRQEFGFYAKWYEKLRKASLKYTPGMEELFYIAQIGFTQQYHVLLAPILEDDSEKIIHTKIRLAATYLDIFLHRRMWNFRDNGYSTLSYTMFQLIRAIRGKTIPELHAVLLKKLNEEDETFLHSRMPYRLHGMNRKHIKHFLARMTAYVEDASGLDSGYRHYVLARGNSRYEVEHILPDHPERYINEFGNPQDFSEHRNLIGDLLLLSRQVNASYNDLPYQDKLTHYHGQNILAKSLHPDSYKHNPGFTRFVADSKLPFKAYEKFGKAEILDRQELYNSLADRVWSVQRIDTILAAAKTEGHG